MKLFKILYIMHYLDLVVQIPVINFLRKHDLQVDIHLLGQKEEEFAGSRIMSEEGINEVNVRQYDFIFCNTHSSWLCAPLKRKLIYKDGTEKILQSFEGGFFEAAKPKFGYVDIEHDLFTPYPEHFPKSFVVSFHQKHYDFCIKNNIPTVKCRWPKMDMRLPERELLKVNPWQEAVLVANNSCLADMKTKPTKLFGFKKVWFKKHFESSPVPKGLSEMPSHFEGHLGIMYCIDNFKFILAPISSCFVESLLFGKLPILLPFRILKETKLDSLVSLVEVEEEMVKGNVVNSYEVVTTYGLNKKMKMLKNKNVYDEVVKRLRSQWWPDNSFFEITLREALKNYVYSFLPR